MGGEENEAAKKTVMGKRYASFEFGSWQWLIGSSSVDYYCTCSLVRTGNSMQWVLLRTFTLPPRRDSLAPTLFWIKEAELGWKETLIKLHRTALPTNWSEYRSG